MLCLFLLRFHLNLVGILCMLHGFFLKIHYLISWRKLKKRCHGKAEESNLLRTLYRRNGRFCFVWAASVPDCYLPTGIFSFYIFIGSNLCKFNQANCSDFQLNDVICPYVKCVRVFFFFTCSSQLKTTSIEDVINHIYIRRSGLICFLSFMLICHFQRHIWDYS